MSGTGPEEGSGVGDTPAVHAHRFASRAELDGVLADRIASALTRKGSGRATAVMLSGGTTPRPAYRMLARRRLHPANGLHLIYSDERYVPPDSEASNYRQSRPLLEALSLPEDRILRVRTELLLEPAAEEYEARLAGLLGSGGTIGLGLLGLGADGHTASLFSPDDLSRARGHLAIAVQRPDGYAAVSVTPELLAHVEEPLFVVAGADKRETLAALLGRRADLVAWRAVAGCRSIEVWTEPQAWP